MKLSVIVFLTYFVSQRISAESDGNCPENLRLLCHEQNNCGQCMLAHSCCHWCYSQSVTGHRCDFIDALSECSSFVERNKESTVKVEKNIDFTEISQAEDASAAVQIKPQSFHIVLRKDSPVNLTFTYKAAKNYPLELYYLGDLSYSMKSHLDTLKNLGDALGKSLEKLTKHYKLAYGSFLDKPGMPFILTDQLNYDNPCRTGGETCARTYLFRHSLNFTSDTDEFFSKVRDSKISANIDDMDGALEAIFQILACDKQFGWSDYSRKIILLSTDSLLHTEGDGILAGATAVNTKKLCMVNSTGDYTDPLLYDYPSLAQIKDLLRSHKTNLIVAVTQDKIEHYRRMEKDILEQEAFVGVLKNNSRNILELVKTGFYDFMRQVQFSANTSHAPELSAKLYADCQGNGHFNESTGCQNVEEEVPIHFKLEISLKETTQKFSEYFYLKEKNINENIAFSVEYVGGTCECSNYINLSEIECSSNGYVNCGSCICDLGWKGATCSEECIEDPHQCREDENSLSCSGVGDCLCGSCTCPVPFTGQYCEYECPMKFGRPCSGRGTCFEGKCSCNKGYTQEDCSCQDASDECRLSSDNQDCNGNGRCECNKCLCEEGYSGKYCEVFKNKNMLCDKYEKSVIDYLTANSTNVVNMTKDTVLLEEWKNDRLCGREICSTVYYGNLERCLVDYCYHDVQETVHLGITNKKCVYTAQAKGITLGLSIFLAIILGGILMIIIKKYQIYREEKAEFKRFMEAKTVMKEENPLYISPVSSYKNPMLK